MAPTRRRYRGFISYSQQDARKADRLHKALERYHVPEGLAPDQVDPSRRRLGRFFRDMEDMSAAADISATVRGAIEDSECLIVVCSPRSAKSRWVAGEIEYFRQLGRGERIYAVIIEGEPNSGDPETECFPPALRVDAGVAPRPDAMPIEPVGIDLRKQSMARACARIAAGLLDLRFDDLWQRDRRDAQRRLLLGGGSAATALIGVFAAFFLTGADRLRAFSAQRSMDFANAARSASERGDLDAAARFALAGIMGADMPVFGFDASAAEAELRRALAAGPFRYAVADAGAVAFSPDGSRMVTGHRSGEAVVSDARTGRAIARLSETHGVPTSVFSPDGQAVLTFDESSSARLWDPTTGREIAALRGHRGAIVKASFDRTGRRVITVSVDGGARIWDGASGGQIVELRNPDEPILEAWFLPRSGLVLTATYHGAMQTWDGSSGRVTSVWRALSSEQRVRHILLSPDGTRLYVHSEFPSDGADPANGLLLLFAPNGQAVAELNAEADPLESAAFSSDSRLLAVGQIDGTVQVWATRNGAPRARVGERSSPLPDGTLAPRAVQAVAFMPDGSGLLSRVATDRCPRLWRLSNDEVPLLSETNAPCGGEQIIPNNDGSLIALTSHVGGVQLWSAASPSRLEILPGALSEFGFSDDGSRLFSASARETRVWDVASRELLADIATASDVAPAFGPGGRQIVTASREQAEVWDGASGAGVARLRVDDAAVAALGFDEAGARALVVHNDGRAEVRGIGGDRTTWLIDVPAGEVTGRFIGDGTRVFATITDEAGGFGAVAGAGVWDGRSGRQLVNFASTPPSAYGLAISANGSRVLDAFGGNVLNIDTGAVVYNYQPTLLQGRPSIAGLSSDGALIANFLPNARVEVRSIDDATTSVVLVGFERLDEDFSSPPAFSPDGRLIAATNGQLGRVWDAKSGRLIATFGEGQRLGRLGLPRFSAGGAELAVITGAEPRGNLGEASGRAIGLWRTPLPLLALRADLVARTCAVMGATGAGRFRAEDFHAASGLGLNPNSDACASPTFLLLVVRALGL